VSILPTVQGGFNFKNNKHYDHTTHAIPRCTFPGKRLQCMLLQTKHKKHVGGISRGGNCSYTVIYFPDVAYTINAVAIDCVYAVKYLSYVN